MPHALLVAAIFIPYAALMTGLTAYMWSQVRDHGDGERDDVRQQEEDRAEMRLAA